MSLSVTDLNVDRGRAHPARDHLRCSDGQHVGIIGSSGPGKSVPSLATAWGCCPRVRALDPLGRPRVAGGLRELCCLRGSQISMMFQDLCDASSTRLMLGKRRASAAPPPRSARRRPARGHRPRAFAEVALLDPARIARSFPRGLKVSVSVALAMTLAACPRCSSPTTAPDVVKSAHRPGPARRGHPRARRGALLFVSHDLPVVARMADRVIVGRRPHQRRRARRDPPALTHSPNRRVSIASAVEAAHKTN